MTLVARRDREYPSPNFSGPSPLGRIAGVVDPVGREVSGSVAEAWRFVMPRRVRSDDVARYWDAEAPGYDRSIAWVDRRLVRDGRAWVCTRATGRTLEVGVGTGRNLAFYPDHVQLTGIDVSAGMLEIARRRADQLGRPVRLRVADAQRLPFGDESFDTVTATLSMCAVPDLGATLSELHRVLRPGGQLVLLDHVRPSSLPLRWLLGICQVLVDVLRPTSGERFLRRPLELLPDYGFALDESERSLGGAIERLRAHRPG